MTEGKTNQKDCIANMALKACLQHSMSFDVLRGNKNGSYVCNFCVTCNTNETILKILEELEVL